MATTESRVENKERDQDRVHDTLDHFQRFGFVMFPQNMKMYENIARMIAGKWTLEAGCGMGLGTAILSQSTTQIIGTDKLRRNVDFAKALYPWIKFDTWDLASGPYSGTPFPVVVCLEAIEHVKNYREGLKNLMLSGKEVWVSAPNSTESPPSNPFHIREFTPAEMVALIKEIDPQREVEALHWDTMSPVPPNSDASPIIYHIR